MSSDNFFIIERSKILPKIEYRKPEKYFDTSVFEKYSDIRDKVSTSNNTNIKTEHSKIKQLLGNLNTCLGSNYLELIFNMKQDLKYINYKSVISSNTSNYNKPVEKYLNIVSTMQVYDEIKILDMCKRENVLVKYWLHRYLVAFRHLKNGGNMLIPIFNFCFSETVDLVYLGELIFEKLIIYKGQYIYLENFNPKIDVKIISNLLNKSANQFIVTPKKDLSKFEKYLKIQYTQLYKLYKNIYDKNLSNVMKEFYLDIITKLQDTKNDQHFTNSIIKVYQEFYAIFRHLPLQDSIVKIHSGIKSDEGRFLKKLIVTNKLNKIAEVGMAFGISAMYITEGLKINNEEGKLISIDPNQTSQWKDEGVHLLEHLKLNKYHDLIQKKSYIALPELLEKYGSKSFDMLFIDGWHTFDYTLVDAFYADKLVRIGGYIVIDDALHFSVQRCIRYLDTNYEHLKRISGPKTFAIYKVKSDDTREWNFHKHF